MPLGLLVWVNVKIKEILNIKVSKSLKMKLKAREVSGKFVGLVSLVGCTPQYIYIWAENSLNYLCHTFRTFRHCQQTKPLSSCNNNIKKIIKLVYKQNKNQPKKQSQKIIFSLINIYIYISGLDHSFHFYFTLFRSFVFFSTVISIILIKNVSKKWNKKKRNQNSIKKFNIYTNE